jgi:hypothetical protein
MRFAIKALVGCFLVVRRRLVVLIDSLYGVARAVTPEPVFLLAAFALISLTGCSEDTPIPEHIVSSQRGIANKLSKLHARFKLSDAGEIESVQFVNSIETQDPDVHDRDLACLQGLRSLRGLSLLETHITSRGIEVVSTLPWLETIATPIFNDSDITHVSVCRGLKDLTLSGRYSSTGLGPLLRENPHVSILNLFGDTLDDQCCQGVNGLSGLKELRIIGQPVTDQFLDAIRSSLLRIEVLVLCETRVTDLGLHAISESASLRRLVLTSLALTDIGVQQLSKSENLSELVIAHIPVTDACVRWLCEIPNLQSLTLIRTKISEAGLSEIRRVRPLVRLKDVGMTTW